MARYKTSVASYAVNINNTEEDVMLNTIGAVCYKHEYPINRSILRHLHNSLAVKVKKIMQYGRDTYTYGLPDGYEIRTTINQGDIKAAVEADLGMEVDIYASFLDEPSYIMFARDYAQRNWGWRQSDNWLANSPMNTTPEYTEGPPQPGDEIYYHKTYLYDADVNAFDGLLYMDVMYGGENTTPPGGGAPSFIPKLKGFTGEPIIPVDPDKFYYHVRWTPKGEAEMDHQYWFYELGSGGHPDLDIDNVSPIESPFLPIIPIKENKKNMGPEAKDGEYIRDENGDLIRPDTELYTTSKQLCKYAGIDFDEITREVYSNPDAAEVEHVYLTFSIDLRTERETSMLYLYQFFDDLSQREPYGGSLEIKDAKYNIRINYSYCIKTIYTGVLDKKVEIDYFSEHIKLRHQINATQYAEIYVRDLEHRNYIYNTHAVKTTVGDSAGEDNYNFQIPLRYDLSLQGRGTFQREELYRESLKIIFNDYERRKIKWYETALFKAIMIVIAVILAIWSSGTSLAYIATLYTAYGVIGVILYVAAMAALSQLIKYGFTWLAEEIGPEWSIAIGVVLAIVGALMGDSTAMGGIINADTMLAMSSALISGASSNIQESLQEINDELASFMEYAKQVSEELEELQEEFNYNGWVDPYEFIGEAAVIIPHETPEEFYNRTIHAGNIGAATLSQVETFVENKLELPKLKTNAEKTKYDQ